MDCKLHKVDRFHRIVGDPVDIVTGSNTDVTVDFTLAAPFPLMWRRYYNSADNKQHRSLGWGHAHEFDHQLHFDIEGIRYTDPAGMDTFFPPLDNDGDFATSEGITIHRIDSGRYRIYQDQKPEVEFEIRDPQKPALLKSLRLGPYRISFEYTANGYLERILDSEDRSIRVVHDQSGCILQLMLADPDSLHERQLLAYTYNHVGNLIQGVDPYGSSFSFEYDAEHRMIQKTDRRGYSFVYEYDNQGRCIHAGGEDGLLDVRLEYKLSILTTIVTKWNGGKWTYSYNENGTVLEIIDPYEGIQSFKVDQDERISEEVDPNRNVKTYEYSDEGAFLGSRDCFGRFYLAGESEHTDTFTYTPQTSLEWEVGHRWAFSTIRLPRADDPVLRRLPTAVANLIRKDPTARQPPSAPQSSRRVRVGTPPFPGDVKYDLFGNLVSAKHPDGTTERWRYDPSGNIIAYIDGRGSVWRFEYARWNLLSRSMDPLGNTKSYEYDNSENIIQAVDPASTKSQYEYDLKDRKISVIRHGVLKESYHYDRADALIEKRNSHGDLLFGIQVGAGNLAKRIDFPNGDRRDLEYDDRGRLIQSSDRSGDSEWEYTDLDLRARDIRDGLGIRHSYRGAELVETLVFGRFSIRYHLEDDGSRVITDPTGRKHRFQTAGNGLFVRVLSNGTRELSQYDWNGRCLLKVGYGRDPGSVLWSRQYKYSEVGTHSGIVDSQTGRRDYEYDAAHRLTAEIDPQSKYRQEYTYDSAGNLLSAPDLGGVSVSENKLVTANGEYFDYNQRNHVARRRRPSGRTEYEYDSEDRLIRCRQPDGEWAATYDGSGRRTSKTWQGRKTTYYWDGERIMGEILADGKLRIYVYADLYTLVPFMFVDYDSIDADLSTGQQYFVFANQIGCPLRIEDTSGQVVWSAQIAPYGLATLNSQNRIRFNLRFPGHYADDETGLYYNRHRYYDPSLGRYIQSDPADIERNINVYAYSARPLDEVDIDGLGCPKKMVLEPADANAAKGMRAKAKKMAENIKKRLQKMKTGREKTKRKKDADGNDVLDDNGKPDMEVRTDKDGNPIEWTEHENHTVDVMVVQKRREDGSVYYDTETTISGSPNKKVKKVIRDETGKDPVSPSVKTPGDVEAGGHAEQRGNRWADEQGDVDGVTSHSPTRPCCEGCTNDIQSRGDPNLDSVEPLDGQAKSRVEGIE